ncbi:MMPL family transporter [Knoellia sp. 3-2P3]|uniref:MMPL family transporter n=1 Tax=unclassified Knoellia TaxID=2618719 RepID=UPI0031F438D1
MTDLHPDRRNSALSHLGASMARHPRVVVTVWLLAVVAAFGSALGVFTDQSLFDRLESGEPTVSGENLTGRDLLTEAGEAATDRYMLQVSGVDADSPEVARTAVATARTISEIEGVESVGMPYVVPEGLQSPQAKAFLKDEDPGSDGFLTVVSLDPDLSGTEGERVRAQVDRELDAMVEALPGATGQTGGLTELIDDITHQVEQDLRTGEGVALPVSFLLMVVVFGGFVSAGMPVLGAVAAIGGALASLLGFSYLIDLDATVVNVVTVLGLGLCIDYGLLTVSRFREELRARARGMPARDIPQQMVVDATARTVDAAGRTVIFSGLTVAISLGGLLVFEAPIMRAIGSAALSVVLVAILVAITLIPALAALGARRLLRKGTEEAPEHGVFSRLAIWVHDRPVPIIAGVLGLLVFLALPALDMRLTSSGAELLPRDAAQRVFFEDLAEHYPTLNGPDLRVVAQSTPEQAAEYARDLPTLDGQEVTATPQRVNDQLSTIGIDVPGGPLDDGAREMVRALQADRPDFPTYVVGQASALQDFTDSMFDRAVIAFALVAIATLVLLFLMTGSVVIPIKALLINVVSLGASLGVLVWVFQQGHLEGLLRFDSVGALESMIPLLILAFGFGLSMDYEVFLLSRIVELHEQGYSNDDAVVMGLQRSGRIITSAALLVVIVFSGFVAGQLLVIKQTGVGLAVAVLIDATLVRMLLVPATMAVLGDWNWWAPARLRRLHARFGITE